MVSAEISKRLQEGWTLLNEHCPMPNCGTPLLKDHKKEIYCAKCQMYCISAEKAKSLGSLNGSASASAAAGGGAVPEQQRVSAPGAEARRSRAAAEAAMGDKLLQGWTMLAQECPTAGCCFPLLRDRSRNTTCVACGGDGVAATWTSTSTDTPRETPHQEDTESNGQFADPPAVTAPSSTVNAPPPAAPASAPAPTPTPTPAPHSNDATEEPEPVISEQEFAAVRKKRDALSASLGRYMLQGWSLLDKMCPRKGCEPGTPLLKNRSTNTFYCAGCDARMRDGETGDLIVESTEASGSTAGLSLSLKRDSSGERSRNVPLTAKGADVPSASSVHSEAKPMQVESEYELAEKARLRKQAAREQSSGNAASATLAQRLLQGWAMLSATCPEPGCHNPLMRDRDGREQCVSCHNAGVKANATVRPPIQEPAAGAGAAAVPVQAAGDFAGEMETEDEEDQALLDDGVGRMYAERRMEELLAGAAGGAAAGTEQAVESDVEGDPVDRLRIQSQALDSLYRALDLSQKRLRACCSSLGLVDADVDESMRQADLITKLAAATRAVSELPSGS